MTMSLRRMRENAFLQLDRITVRRRRLLERWLDNAINAGNGYYGMSEKERAEINRTLQDIRACCATERQPDG